ncbi:MAG: OOP family OmpA-OmpF porin [Arenicella sp.]|jgi:OOP family OmpA-OmpF porin
MKKTILFFCFVIHPFFAFSQTNIVSNGSFEEFEGSQIPFYVEQLKGWKLLKPTEAGYIHPKRKYFTPTKSAWGVQKAKEGKAYVFTKFGGKPVGGYHDFGDATRTYLQTELIRPLRAGVTYPTSFNVSFADKSNCAVNRIGIYFSNEPIDTNSYDRIIEFKIPQLMTDTVIYNSKNWTQIGGDYVATGGEKFITIGVFGPEMFVKSKKFRRGSHFLEAFYFLDDVKVIEPLSPTKHNFDSLFTNSEGQTFDQIQFKTGSTELEESAFPILDELANYLSANFKNVQINGHTDDVGNQENNQKLSEARANSVKNYLIGKLVDSARLQAIGKGDSEPIAPNDSNSNRRKNRRVVFVIED